MVDTYTTGKLGLIEPSRGAYVGIWDEPLYANWQTLEACISKTTTLTLSNANVVLTVPTYPTYSNPPSVATSCQNLRLYLTGTLAANLTIFIPATVGGFWIVDDATTGNYTVTIKTTAVGSTGINSVQGKTLFIFSNGTNVKLADSGNTVDPSFLVYAGTILSFGGTTAPVGYLACDGTAVSRTTYANLFSAIGTTWGPGDSSTTFNLPDLRDYFLRGSTATKAVALTEADGVGPLTINDPGHSHQYQYKTTDFVQSGSNTPCWYGNQSVSTSVATTGITITNTISETRPKNKRVLYIIKT